MLFYIISYCTDYGLVLAIITVEPDGPVPYRQVSHERFRYTGFVYDFYGQLHVCHSLYVFVFH